MSSKQSFFLLCRSSILLKHVETLFQRFFLLAKVIGHVAFYPPFAKGVFTGEFPYCKGLRKLITKGKVVSGKQ